MIGGAFTQNNPPSSSRISDVVLSRWSTGYFGSAVTLVQKNLPIRELLRRYPALLDHFYLHPRQKPPGLLLFEIAIVHLFGSGTSAAMISGLLTGFIASLAVVSTYFFIAFSSSPKTATRRFFRSQLLFALCPSFLLFFPDFDSGISELHRVPRDPLGPGAQKE